jgi:hypothetical protein
MTREIPLTQGKVALVDDADYQWLMQWKWYFLARKIGGYAVRQVRGPHGQILTYMHRVIVTPPAGLQVDHIDGNKLNNVRSNLRIATQSQNCANKPAKEGITSGYKGVMWTGTKWGASIRGKWLGSFAAPEEAAIAYDHAAIQAYGQFAYLNFPQTETAPALER